MINPYNGVNWGNVKHVHSASHMHHDATCSKMQEDGFEHLAISNYYPSQPILDYKIIVDPNWGSDDFLPEGMFGSPNAEHHNSIVGNRRNGDFHFNSLGSTWDSGKGRNEEPIGIYDKTWQTAFDLIISELKVPDGGGITINHPNWYLNADNKLNLTLIQKFLDYDERVLGIEVFNASSALENMGWALDVWDDLLITGRRVWGFFVTDHPNKYYRPYQGRNVLLVDKDNFTEEECLKAYREGRFYGKIFNTDLQFEEIKCENNVLTVKTNNAESIKIVVDGAGKTFEGAEVTYTVPKDAVYVRAEAYKKGKVVSKETGEEKEITDSIFSNPFMLDPQVEPPVDPPVEPTTKRRRLNKLMWF